MQKKSVLRKNPNMVTRQIDDELILLPIYKNSQEINCIYSLNKVASRIWNLIDGIKTSAQIKARLLKEFDATPREVDKKINAFVKELKEIKAIK